ncbi:MAG: hypothetical protein NW215_15745 [Hyphomicrobiales bacterium]|nr:hypothetical protein [Hyphomicrobiales bacterium]
MRRMMAVLSLGVAVLGVAGGADAQPRNPPEVCEAYAREAVAQNARNLSSGCGFAGARWSADLSGHLTWCQIFPRAAAEEERERARLLDRCATGPRDAARRAACAHYGAVAVTQAASNAAHGCGMTGPRWLPDRETHETWCLTQRPGATDAETDLRERELAFCFAKMNDYADYAGDCDGYARLSVRQNEANQFARCGLQGLEWVSDYRVHKAFCDRLVPGEGLEILRVRQRALDACRRY